MMEALQPWIVPFLTIGVVVFVQLLFWIPTRDLEKDFKEKTSANLSARIRSKDIATESAVQNQTNLSSSTIQDNSSAKGFAEGKNNDSHKSGSTTMADWDDTNNDFKIVKQEEEEEDLFKMNDQWRCACEGGFLPPGLLKSFGGAEAVMRLGTGQCYHKQT